MRGEEALKLLKKRRSVEVKQEEGGEYIVICEYTEQIDKECIEEDFKEEEQDRAEGQTASGKIYLTSRCYTCQTERRKEFVGMHYNWLQFRCPVCGTVTCLDKDNVKYFKNEIEGDVNILGF